jgi:hypothetical protein
VYSRKNNILGYQREKVSSSESRILNSKSSTSSFSVSNGADNSHSESSALSIDHIADFKSLEKSIAFQRFGNSMFSESLIYLLMVGVKAPIRLMCNLVFFMLYWFL